MATNSDIITTALTNALNRQSVFVRRKDSIAAIAGAVIQLGNLISVMQADLPENIAVIIAIVTAVAQFFIHAATPGAITPSMEQRLINELPPTPPIPSVTYMDEVREELSVAPDTIGAVIEDAQPVGRHRANGLEV